MRRFYASKGLSLILGLEEGSIVCLFSFEELSQESKAKVIHDYNDRASYWSYQEGVEHIDYTIEEVSEYCIDNECLYIASGEEVYYDSLQEVL